MHLKLHTEKKKGSILDNYDIYKMIPKEHTTATDHAKNFKASSSAKTWSRLNDPRIVRVSRAFGGKDRHSKVCTVRGLRDRRVRLSVPTAIQLYNLQERLGLNQPSKVIDWLLNAAKSDIDELPPLQFPPGSFSLNNLQTMQKTDYSHEKQPVLRISGNINWINDPFKNPACRSSFVWGSSNKDASRETIFDKDENPARIDDQEDGSHEFSMERTQGTTNYINSPNNFFPRSNPPSLPYNSFLKWDPSSDLTLSNPPRNYSPAVLSSSQPEDFHSFNLLQFPSTLSVYQPGISTQIQSYFPSQISSMNTEFFLKHQNFQSSQLSNPSVIPVRPFGFGMTATLLSQSQNYNSKSVRNNRE